MKKIAINVPPNLAEAFENADGESKRKAELFINAWLTDFFSKQTANDRLFDIMKKATKEASAADSIVAINFSEWFVSTASFLHPVTMVNG